MKVKISDKILCIPPYISTTWDQVTFLQTETNPSEHKLMLVLHLQDGKVVKIPHLDAAIIDIAFAAHIQHMESAISKKDEIKEKNLLHPLLGISSEQIASFPIRLGISGNLPGMEGLENAFQHNPAQAHFPSLPKELIEKISSIARILTNGDLSGFPKAEPHCNCLHCQVARSIHGAVEQEETSEEQVSAEDLSFRDWEILQTGEKLYLVSNPIDSKEQYNVYLGQPIGCTCGQIHCEHIRAVLSS